MDGDDGDDPARLFRAGDRDLSLVSATINNDRYISTYVLNNDKYTYTYVQVQKYEFTMYTYHIQIFTVAFYQTDKILHCTLI